MQLWYGGVEQALPAMRTTPTEAMEMLLDLPTLSTVVEAPALTAAYCLPRPDQKALEMGHMAESGRKMKRWTISSQLQKITQPGGTYWIKHIK